MTLIETMKLPNFKMFYRPPEGPTYYWDDSGMLCGSDGKSVKVTKNLLAEQYIISCDHSRYFPVGQGSNWHLKCADCLCDLEIVGVREPVKMPDNHPPTTSDRTILRSRPDLGVPGEFARTAKTILNELRDQKNNVMPCL